MSTRSMIGVSGLLRLGIDPADNPKEKLRKNFLVFVGVLMSGGGILWGSICLSAGLWIPAVIPLSYAVITIFNLILFHATRRFGFVRMLQTLISLLLPFFFQWSLGGFWNSGVMMLWALLSLVASMTYEDAARAVGWLLAFLALTVASLAVDSYVRAAAAPIDPSYTIVFLTLNVALVSSAVIGLFIYMVKDRDKAVKELDYKAALTSVLDTVRHTVQGLNELSERVQKTAGSLSAEMSKQEEGMAGVSVALETLSDSVGDIVQQAQDQASAVESGDKLFRSHSETMTTASQEASTAAALGQRSAGIAIESRSTIRTMKQDMSKLEDSAESISEISSVIDSIVERIDLLSLNASIEAARAGEHGRGFSVVASEIGKLANQSKDQVASISGVVSNTVALIQERIQQMESAAARMDDIESSVLEAKDAAQRIQGLHQAEAHVIDSLRDTMRNVAGSSGHIVQSTVVQREHLSRVASELDHLARVVQSVRALSQEL
ncbi:MAG: hypothetical protein HY042_11725, partial [Spirochaetia bacterium]|nr:hypothetical protein [Spirochaetia bacterium]